MRNKLYTISELHAKRTSEFLKENPYIVLDTRHFDRELLHSNY